MRREWEEKRIGDGLYSEGSNRGRTKEKEYQGRGKSQGRGDLNDIESYYYKTKGHKQMMCKEMKEDLKRIRSLSDGGRKENENCGNAALGFVGDDDEYDGTLLVNWGEGVVHNKK